MWGYVLGGLVAAVVLPGTFRALKQVLRPKIAGIRGEAAVHRKLRKFKKVEAARLKDIMLPAPGQTAQIDNILVSKHGVFVIEMKNYSGIVQGSERDPQWTQIIHKRNFRRSFLNPVWQNKKHVEALTRCLKSKFPRVPCYGLVVFGNKCSPPRLPGVCNLRDMCKFISEKMEGPAVLSSDDVSAIQKIIEDQNITDKKRRLQHISDANHSAKTAEARASYAGRSFDTEHHRQSGALLKNSPLDAQIRAASGQPHSRGTVYRGSYEQKSR